MVFGFFTGPGKQHGRWRRRCPLRESLRGKEKNIANSKRICSKRHVLFSICDVAISFFVLIRFGSVLVGCLGGYDGTACVEVRELNGR